METMQKTKELSITRTFDASIEKVWQAWSDPEYLKKWWAPKNFTTPYYRMRFAEGSKYLNCMRSPEGKDYWSTGVYKEIVPMQRIVYTDSFSDNLGDPISAALYGMSPDFQTEMLVTVTFKQVNDKTQMTLTHEGLPESEKENCANGWNEMFDKLDEFLK